MDRAARVATGRMGKAPPSGGPGSGGNPPPSDDGSGPNKGPNNGPGNGPGDDGGSSNGPGSNGPGDDGNPPRSGDGNGDAPGGSDGTPPNNGGSDGPPKPGDGDDNGGTPNDEKEDDDSTTNPITRPGYRGPAEGYRNNMPQDLETGKPFLTLQQVLSNPDVKPLIGAGGTVTYAAKYIYVITKMGQIRLGRYLTHHHPDLVDGENVYGAGQMLINEKGEIFKIDDQSGHYFPRDGSEFGTAFFDYMQHILASEGILVSKDIFAEY